MSSLFPTTQYYKEFIHGESVKGKITNSYSNNLEFIGNIQPVTQKDQQLLEIGRKELGKVQVFTDHVFNICKEGEQNKGDLVLYDENYYEILALNNHLSGLLPHRFYVAELRLNIV